MITNDMLQEMINKVNSNDDLKQRILGRIKFDDDHRAIERVLKEGWYEAFDRYDSDVAEKFIRAYQKETN